MFQVFWMTQFVSQINSSQPECILIIIIIIIIIKHL